MKTKLTLALVFTVFLSGFDKCGGDDIKQIGLCGEPAVQSSSSLSSSSTRRGVLRRQARRAARRGETLPTHEKLGLAKRTELLDAVVCMGGYPTTPPPTDGVTPPASPCSTGTLTTPNRIVTAKHMNPSGLPVRFTFGDEARWNPEGSVNGVRCWEFRHNHVTGVSRAATCCNHIPYPPRDAKPEHIAAYNSYLTSCKEPMGKDEGIISDLAVYELAERITDIKPIPTARTTPAGDHNVNYFKGQQGYLAGLGRTMDNAYTGLRHWGGVILEGAFDEAWTDGDGDPITLQFFYSSNDGGAASLAGDSGGPVFANYGDIPLSERTCENPDDWKVIGTIYLQGNGAQSMTFDAKTGSALDKLLDPDGDGIDVGYTDAHSPGAVDADGDGFAEYFMDPVSGVRKQGQDNCPTVSNADQKDRNGDGIGDACS